MACGLCAVCDSRHLKVVLADSASEELLEPAAPPQENGLPLVSAYRSGVWPSQLEWDPPERNFKKFEMGRIKVNE